MAIEVNVNGTCLTATRELEENMVSKGEKVKVDISVADVGGHNGGDFFMMNNLYKEMNGMQAEGITYLDVSIESHLMSFAAEESRVNNGAAVVIKKN